MGPFLRLRDLGERGTIFVRLIGRAMAEADPAVQGMLAPFFRKARGPFLAALRRALPDLPEEELAWRIHFLTGAMAHAMACEPTRAGGSCPSPATGELLRWLVRFLEAGMRAPSGSAGREGER